MNNFPSVPEGQSFSAEVVNSALAGLPEELAQDVATRLVAHAAESKRMAALQDVQLQTALVAVIAHQNYQEDTPDDLDDISLDRATRDESIVLLSLYSNLPEESRAEIPPSVIDFASCFYVQREVQFGADDKELTSVLAPAGITLPMMYDRLTQLVWDSGKMPPGRTIEDLRRAAPILDRIVTNVHLTEMLQRLATKMRGDLLAQGYTLPELGPDNTYGYDEEEESYRLPTLDSSVLPPRSTA